jgi:uncharacterized membrane protein YhaH (DUF805 family)
MRGRMNRATYWLCLGILAAAVGIMSVAGIRPPRIGEATLILMCVPRLHDLGKSGWWVLIPIGIELVAIVAAIAMFSTEDAYIVFGAVFLVVAGFIVVLGLIPGQPQANRFGEPPKSPFAFRERAKVSQTEEIFK